METKKKEKKKIEKNRKEKNRKEKIESKKKERKERKESKKKERKESKKSKKAKGPSRTARSRRSKVTRKKKYKKDKHKRKKLRELRKKLKEKEKETKQHIKEVEKELKQNLARGQYNINIITLKLIAHLKLPIDILSKITQEIEETEKIEIEKINIKLKNIKEIINNINIMTYPQLFNDYLSEDSENTFTNLEALTQEIEEQKKSMTQRSISDDIIEKNLNLIQTLFDGLYKITNDLLLDEHDFYYELEYLSTLLENMDRLTNPQEMQVEIRRSR